VLYKTDPQVQFLYGDNVSHSPNIVARAEIKSENIHPDNEFVFFEMNFDYDSFRAPFTWEDLENNVYKLTIVFSSSARGQYYEGRPGNTLIVGDVSLLYDTPPAEADNK
jgi:hypothetical protein